MATESVATPVGATDLAWRPNFGSETPRDTADRKLYQAEMLAHALCGDGGEGFRAMNDPIQEGVMWLLASLLTEAREAVEAADSQGNGPDGQAERASLTEGAGNER